MNIPVIFGVNLTHLLLRSNSIPYYIFTSSRARTTLLHSRIHPPGALQVLQEDAILSLQMFSSVGSRTAWHKTISNI